MSKNIHARPFNAQQNMDAASAKTNYCRGAFGRRPGGPQKGEFAQMFYFGDGVRTLQIGPDSNFYRINCYRENDRDFGSVIGILLTDFIYTFGTDEFA